MLDSDLCLAYDIDISVQETCCAWTEHAEGCGTAENCCAVQTHPVLGENPVNFKGPRPNPHADGQCSRDANLHNADDGQQSSLVSTHQYVKEFAEDESAWISSFLPAWRTATTNGVDFSIGGETESFIEFALLKEKKGQCGEFGLTKVPITDFNEQRDGFLGREICGTKRNKICKFQIHGAASVRVTSRRENKKCHRPFRPNPALSWLDHGIKWEAVEPENAETFSAEDGVIHFTIGELYLELVDSTGSRRLSADVLV